MHKTTIYIDEVEAEGLRRLAAATGVSQASLVRAGIRHVLEEGMAPRRFRSMGQGASRRNDPRRWSSDELHARRRPDRKS